MLRNNSTLDVKLTRVFVNLISNLALNSSEIISTILSHFILFRILYTEKRWPKGKTISQERKPEIVKYLCRLKQSTDMPHNKNRQKICPKNKESIFTPFLFSFQEKRERKKLFEDNGIDVHGKNGERRRKIFIRDAVSGVRKRYFLCLMYVFITHLRKIEK